MVATATAHQAFLIEEDLALRVSLIPERPRLGRKAREK